MDLQRHLWKIVLGVALLTGAAYELWPPLGYEGVASAGLSALALAAALMGIHLHRPLRRLPWYLVAFCSASWVVGYSIQQFYVSSGIGIPVGYAADAFYLAGNAALIAALVLLLMSRESRFDSSLDVGIVVLAVSQLAWATLISAYALDGTLPLLARTTQIAYAFTDVVMLALVARILVAPGKKNASLLLVSGGVASILVADFGFNWLTLAGINTATVDFLPIWSFALLLFGAAAAHPEMSRLFPTKTVRGSAPQWSYLGLLFVAASVTPVILATKALSSSELDKHLVLFCAVTGGALMQLVLVRMVGFFRAVSSSRALALQNERLRELDALKDEFIASVSHELRTPLTSIQGYLELVQTEESENLRPEQREFLAIVDRNSERLLGLVSDLLFVAQVDAGRLELTLAETDLGLLVEQTVESARPAAAEKGIRLNAEVEERPLIHADRGRLAQVLDNLVSNALKFTPPGGLVRVKLRASEAKAILEVSDSGVGMPAEDQEHLFDRFYRTPSARQQAVPGTGLGLSIAKAIVDGHQGTIGVNSSEGRGTVFRIELPLAGSTRILLPSKVAA
jgi:signal transduction histidine kinase